MEKANSKPDMNYHWFYNKKRNNYTDVTNNYDYETTAETKSDLHNYADQHTTSVKRADPTLIANKESWNHFWFSFHVDFVIIYNQLYSIQIDTKYISKY